MQIARFENGGFALHRITLDGYKGRFSAWYDVAGALLDCEQITPGFPNGRRAPCGAKLGLEALGQRMAATRTSWAA
jgi:hypothetical protein